MRLQISPTMAIRFLQKICPPNTPSFYYFFKTNQVDERKGSYMSFDLKIVGGDIAISKSGNIEIVSNNEKLKQDIVKILLTKTGSNKYHPAYGSEIGILQIGHAADAELLELDLQSSAEEAIRKLISLQKKQSKRQFLSPAEVIVDIVEISVARDVNDPRAWNIFISVLTQKLTTLTESIQLRII